MLLNTKVVLESVLWFKNAPNMKRNAVVLFPFGVVFFGVFLGKFGEIWAKILRTPKICLLLHLCNENNSGNFV